MLVTQDHGQVRELRLDRPPVNALNPALLHALRAGLEGARRDGCGGIVLSGAPGFFSAGLDVPELLTLGRPEITDTWRALFALLVELASSEIPMAAALTGHSPAGGTVLALFADYRVMAEGRFRLGLNEVQVGLPLPEVIFRALRYVVGERQAERLAVGGLMLDPGEALRVGLVDEVVDAAAVIPRALGWMAELLSRPRAAMSGTRAMARRPLHEAFDSLNPALIERVVDQWFSAETQAVMRSLADRLGKPRPA